MAKNNTRSIEPIIEHLGNSWLTNYRLDYKPQQEPLNPEIDRALEEYVTKNGGSGKNRPDAKLLLRDKNLRDYPILIEYKGYKDKLVKLVKESGQVDNGTKTSPKFSNINNYAVNGAVHYANAILHHTGYEDVIAIGMSGYRDAFGKIQYQIGVYYVSKKNLGIGQRVGEYSDLSFLAKENFDAFIEQVEQLSLTEEELSELRAQQERDIDACLVKLNNDIYRNDELSPQARIHMVVASIIATLGIPNAVPPLRKDDLKSSTELENTDGDIILRKVKGYLQRKQIPQAKTEAICRELAQTLTSERLNSVENGMSVIRRVFEKIVDNLGIFYKNGLTTDFTGKLFNEMYNWLGFSQDTQNDVVLTPFYVATLLAKLARVNKNSYVWDLATGSASLLVAAMNEMLRDARSTITSPTELAEKITQIKAEQILGVEKLESIYILAVLNMILMGDGSSNILNANSLSAFEGRYGYGRTNELFPADAFVLNPPYSAEGKGMIFMEKGMNMMQRGYAAVLIHTSAGSGKATEINKRILKKHTLLASIKMPASLFIGKASVHTQIYVFKVNEPHEKENVVKFIDFSDDGYTRTNRKRSSSDVNLRDTNNARERYEELVALVKYGPKKLKYYTEREYYEGTIDPENGADWNQSAPVDTRPSLIDFRRAICDYVFCEVSSLLQQTCKCVEEESIDLDGHESILDEKWSPFRLGELFDIEGTKSIDRKNVTFIEKGVNYVGRTFDNNGIQGKIERQSFPPNKPNTITATVIGNYKYAKFQKEEYYCSQNINKLTPKSLFSNWNERIACFMITYIQKYISLFDGQHAGYTLDELRNHKVYLPVTKTGLIDCSFIDCFMRKIGASPVNNVIEYFQKRVLETR